MIMDGDGGRRFDDKDLPLTDVAVGQLQRLKEAGVELRVLRRFGVENYFARPALEAVLKKDLRRYFPLPRGVALEKHLADKARPKSPLRAGEPSPINAPIHPPSPALP